MKAVRFPQATTFFGPPPGLSESQVKMIPAFIGTVQRGSMEGSAMVITAWKPSPDDLARLNQGDPIFLTFLGSLPPHMVSTDFDIASQPA